MRCCFSPCWGCRITSDKNKPQQTNGQKSVISEYFHTLFLFLTSLSACSSGCVPCCGTHNVSLNTAGVGTEKQRMAETHQAGLVGLILASFDWYVRIEIVGNKKSTNTFDVQVAASLGAFTQRLPGQRPVLSCLHIGHQGMKSVHGNEVRPLSKRINQSKAVLRRSAAEWILSPLNLLSSVSKFIFQDFLSLHPRHMWELRYSSVSTMETLSGALRTEDNQDHSTCSPTTAIMC